MDLRVTKTQRAIRAAFLELREKKPLEKITVKELASGRRFTNPPFTTTTPMCTPSPTPWRPRWWSRCSRS